MFDWFVFVLLSVIRVVCCCVLLRVVLVLCVSTCTFVSCVYCGCCVLFGGDVFVCVSVVYECVLLCVSFCVGVCVLFVLVLFVLTLCVLCL